MEAPGAEGSVNSAASLREMLYDAFADTFAPGVDEIVPDYWDFDLERTEIRNAFAGRAWHEIPAGMLAEHRQALFFLTPSAWSYYLPAYMLATIDAYSEADSALTEVVGSLTPNCDPEIEAIRKERLAALTERQRDLLSRFIEWAADEHPEDIDDDEREKIISAIADGIGRG